MQTRVSRLLFIALYLFLTCTTSAQEVDAADLPTSEDIAVLIGKWEGKLTYLNYGDDKYYDVRSTLDITAGENENELAVYRTYPDEMDRSGNYQIRIRKNGRKFNGDKVLSRSVLADGTIQIITQYKGRDANKRARIRLTYSISEDRYSTQKEVQFQGSKEWLKRNEFIYNKR